MALALERRFEVQLDAVIQRVQVEREQVEKEQVSSRVMGWGGRG